MTAVSSEPCFLLGSPRSGTTALAQALGDHPEIAHFYEPYFLWERHAPARDDDVLSDADVPAAMSAYLRREFALFQYKKGATVVIDKTPENAFRVEAIEQVFPAARYIHLVRDGRDATVSIRREWRRRQTIVEQRRLRLMARVTIEMLSRQPFWRNRLQAIAYELQRRIRSTNASLFNKAKWGGAVGWGPRFPGWREFWPAVELLVFNALQWRYSVESTERGLTDVSCDRKMTIYYEELVQAPDQILHDVQTFLGLSPVTGLGRGLITASIGRWREELSAEERGILEQAIGDTLERLGYRT